MPSLRWCELFLGRTVSINSLIRSVSGWAANAAETSSCAMLMPAAQQFSYSTTVGSSILYKGLHRGPCSLYTSRKHTRSEPVPTFAATCFPTILSAGHACMLYRTRAHFTVVLLPGVPTLALRSLSCWGVCCTPYTESDMQHLCT
jgi:hypothetical protein